MHDATDARDHDVLKKLVSYFKFTFYSLTSEHFSTSTRNDDVETETRA